MADLFSYLQWRGDLSLRQVPLNCVDNLLFSTLVYVDFLGIVPPDDAHPVPLHVAAEAFLALADREERVRLKTDLKLLEAMAAAPRFRDVRLMYYQTRHLLEEETQFAAMTYLLPDGTAFLCFRGTDYSLVGWKEDFNMSFRDSIPAQVEALAYTEEFARKNPVLMRLGGHSKGGNLAVYAAAKSAPDIQQRIITVYNNDGPGFTQSLMGDAGYLRMVPKIRTFIPESSVIGILLEHEEPYKVIKSRQVSILQHESYSWECMGGDFVYAEALSEQSQFLDKTVALWIADMTPQQRSDLVDALYNLLRSGGASQVQDLLQPKNILALFREFNTNEQTRKLLTGEFLDFLKIAASNLSDPA